MVLSIFLALLAVTATLSSAAPAPAPQSNFEDLLLYGLPEGADPARLVGRSIVESSPLQKRGRDQNHFRSGAPSCSDDDDPSYAIGKSAYKDGEGTLVKAGECDNGKYTGGWHCWSDIYYVMVQIEYSDWTNTGGVIDCKTTSQCALQGISLNQSCTSNTHSWDNDVQFNLQAKLDEMKKTKWGMGGGFTWVHGEGNSDTTLTCNSVADQGSCSWGDQGCHAIWKGKCNRRVFGYMRRSCDKGRDGTNMSQQRPDGYWTVGMLDFDLVLPENQVIGCAAMCNDVTYPAPKLGGPSEKLPYPGA